MPLLSWFNRDADLTRAALTPYRLLEPVASLSHGEPDSPNMLIEGDNLDVLKALLPYYAGQVKCIFIDPPYNTRSAFEHYEDNLEHSQWLSIMYPRLELLRELLAKDGSIWVTLDDNEAHYFKVICDEIFGRSNFVANVIWQKKYAVANDHKSIAPMHDHLFVYRKSPSWQRNLLPRTDEKDRQYRFEDERGVFRTSDYTCNKTSGERPNLYYPIIQPNTNKDVWPSKTRVWAYSQEEHARHVDEGFIYWGKDGKSGTPSFKRYKHLLKKDGIVPQTLWEHTFAGHTDEARKEVRAVLESSSLTDDFLTPKPERLIERVLQAATNEADLVLDSFLGSGTTAAVAHKMGRRWIGIEMGKHARTHCQPRLKKVVDGEQGGISKGVDWKGGGGFRFYKLGVPMFDENGHIREGIRFEHLAAHVWFAETGTARSTRAKKEAFLGEHGGVGYYLLFNGILGDDSKSGGNVLTRSLLRTLPKFDGPKVIYGEACSLPEEQLRELDITFRQTPYDIKAR
ncbi:MAG TPA: site-specific DNA-methyltransferase [Pseudoxanthomonas sp.]